MVRRSSPTPPVVDAAPPAAVPAIAATPEAISAAAFEAMAVGIASVKWQIDEIAAGRGGDSKHDDGSRIAYLATKAGAILEAVRKAEGQRLKQSARVTPAVVLAWYRSLDPSDRENILREFAQVDAKRNGLA